MEEQEVCEDQIFPTEIAKGRLGEEGQRQRRLSSQASSYLHVKREAVTSEMERAQGEKDANNQGKTAEA